MMKINVFSAVLLLLSTASYAGDPNVSGGMSENLSLTLEFVPKSEKKADHFKITLKNVSGKDLELMIISTSNFGGSIFVTQKGKEAVEYYEKRYLLLLSTGELATSRQKLEKDGALQWKVPITELRDIHDGKLTIQELHRATAHVELGMIAIIPPKGGFIASNAKQTSASIYVIANRNFNNTLQ